MRVVALGLLLLAAVVYVATLNRGGGWGYVHATAEASMVGAIADWFAVTALFRHPLGLPIPHTALIATRKHFLGQSLQAFVAENFLSEPVVRARIANAHVSRRAGAWLAAPEHSARVVVEASRLLRDVLGSINDTDVAALVNEELLPRLAEEPLSEVTGRLLQEVVAEQAHRPLVDLALAEAHRWLLANPGTVIALVEQRAPTWTPQWLDDVVAARVHYELVAWVADVQSDPGHQVRKALDGLLSRLAADLQSDPDTMQRAERLKRRLLLSPQVAATADSLWQALRRSLLRALDDPESLLRRRATRAIAEFGERLHTDQALGARFDGYAADGVAYLVKAYGAEMTEVITDTIERWDPAEASRRIELHVGRDLQFIRVNGTLVGGLAGLLIYAASQLA
jgi:uncharacterized membrane-anchored protein YjiN (DUF445 family)